MSREEMTMTKQRHMGEVKKGLLSERMFAAIFLCFAFTVVLCTNFQGWHLHSHANNITFKKKKAVNRQLNKILNAFLGFDCFFISRNASTEMQQFH